MFILQIYMSNFPLKQLLCKVSPGILIPKYPLPVGEPGAHLILGANTSVQLHGTSFCPMSLIGCNTTGHEAKWTEHKMLTSDVTLMLSVMSPNNDTDDDDDLNHKSQTTVTSAEKILLTNLPRTVLQANCTQLK